MLKAPMLRRLPIVLVLALSVGAASSAQARLLEFTDTAHAENRAVYAQARRVITGQIRFYNQILRQIKLSPLSGMLVSLRQDPRTSTAGGAGFGGAYITYPQQTLDATTVAHEVGHWIHFRLAGQDHSDGVYRTSAELQQQIGIQEGVANILSALFTGEPIIGAHDHYDFVVSVDRYVRFPDLVPTLGDFMRGILSAPLYGAHYPWSARQTRGQYDALFNDPARAHELDLPSPYLSSAVFTQPLWLAAQRFGRGPVLRCLLPALSGYHSYVVYSDLANRILETCGAEGAMHDFLATAFEQRGI